MKKRKFGEANSEFRMSRKYRASLYEQSLKIVSFLRLPTLPVRLAKTSVRADRAPGRLAGISIRAYGTSGGAYRTPGRLAGTSIRADGTSGGAYGTPSGAYRG